MTYDYTAIAALADPTRRAVFELVRERPRSVADLTRLLPVSQPAISQHLKVLREAALVRSERQGTRNIYRLDPTGLQRLRAWLDEMWDEALASFAREIETCEESEMSTAGPIIQPVVKTVRVKVSRDRALRYFSENLGRWWPAKFSIGSSPIVDAKIEPRVGGRWYEIGQDGKTCQWGEVLAWNPPDGLVLAWRINSRWQYDPGLLTEVAVSFHPVGDNETDVTLEHRKLENYGESAGQMADVFASPGGWSAALDRYAEAIEQDA